MCTILVLFQVHPEAPLIIAANRDEFFDRPATGPMVLQDHHPRIVGGLDLRDRGTWMGVNEVHLFAALTNVRSEAPQRHSRGDLVLGVLRCEGVPEATRTLVEKYSWGQYRPFNMLYGTPEEIWIAYARDQQVQVERLSPGLHVVVSSAVADDPDLPKVARARALLEASAARSSLDDLVTSLREVLADHVQPGVEDLPAHLKSSPLGPDLERRLQAICVHTPVYGTRSSTILALEGSRTRYEYCEGPPCQGTWSGHESLLVGP